MSLKFRYEGCRWPFPHRITGDGYDRLMNGLPGAPRVPAAFVDAMERVAAIELRKRLRAEGRLLEPSRRHVLSPLLERILRIIRDNPLKTSREIARIGAFHYPELVSRRINDLIHRGYVETGGTRRQPTTSREANTWRVTEKAPPQEAPCVVNF